MKKSVFLLILLSFCVSPIFAAQERLTTSSHDVIKVTLDGTHKIVVNAVQNGDQPKSVKTLMDEVGGVSAINGAFFCPREKGYSWCDQGTSDMIAIINGSKRHRYEWGDDLGLNDEKALFGFQYDGSPLLVTNSTKSRSNGWVNSEFSKIQYGLSMHVLLVNGVNVAYNNSEMNKDKKQGGAAMKEFICSTEDKSTVYFGKVNNVTFVGLAEYIQKTFGCYDAIQLDAGGSTAIYFEGSKIAGPGRNVMDAFVVVEDRAKYNEELQAAITWMYENGMTMFNDPKSFKAKDPIKREHAAKFFGVLAEDIFDRNDEVNDQITCTFSDIVRADKSLVENILQSCKIGIFKGHNGKFDPSSKLTNAQALAVLSRIVNGNLDNPNGQWYTNYYKSDNLGTYVLADGLKIGSITSADKEATRGEIAIMIYRTANK